MHTHGVKRTHGLAMAGVVGECNELRHEERCFTFRMGKLQGFRSIITQFRATLYVNMHLERQECRNISVEKMQQR
jgi:hypothetical protein